MKKLLLILILLIGLISCENSQIDFPDFKYTSGFFPYQYPVRTLVLGDYIYDNSNDNEHKFIISVAMGGVYENTRNREFDFSVDETLCDNAEFSSTGETIMPLPASYYTLSSSDKITIPAGKLNGGIEVQLNDAFFNDPLAIKNTYVIPLRLVASSDVDSILSGRAIGSTADPRIENHWFVTPKNFTMFAVKYINEYHGTYFYYGSSTVKDLSGTVMENTTYSAKYVEENPTVKLLTTGRYQVSLARSLNTAIAGLTGTVNMLLTFSGNTCTITGAPGSALTISGTGEFKSNEYEWGAKKRDGIILNYTVTNGVNTYSASDVIVSRDRGVIMELFTPRVN
jgi:hypothetical protein